MELTMLNMLCEKLRAGGVASAFQAGLLRLLGEKPMQARRIVRVLRGKVGIEIGGPSSFFARYGLLPIYPLVGRVDNVNFSAETVWEGTIREGLTFQYNAHSPPGYQYITEAADLGRIPSATYDFLLSSHTIEHMANPLRALEEWQRVLKPGSILVVVIPHKDRTFDHRRPVTPLTHLVEDYQNQVGEDNLSHLEEILIYHDLSKDVRAGDLERFRARSLDNPRNRCMHQHVFDTYATIAMLDRAGVQLQQVEAIRPYHIVAVGRTPSANQSPDNRPFLAASAPWRSRSPFPSDHDRDTNSLHNHSRGGTN